MKVAAAIAAAALLLLGAPARATDPPPAPASPPAAAPSQGTPASAAAETKCSSVVIRNCRARFVPDPLPEGTAPGKSADVPGRWEAVRVSDPDAEEIIIEEERLRDPAVREVFDRYLRAAPQGYATRNAAGGARCTTITSSGATFCSRPGGTAPEPSVPRTDFSDAVF